MSMVNVVISTIFSWTFFIGFIVGVVGQRCYCHIKARWLDRHHPLPGGVKHKVGGLDRMWLAAAIALVITGSVMYSTTQTRNATIENTRATERLSRETKECQDILLQTLKDRAAITADDNRLSSIQRKALADWLGILLNPPAEVNALPKDGVEYRNWSIGITQFYYGLIRDAQMQQEKNEQERQSNPLPEPSCGK